MFAQITLEQLAEFGRHFMDCNATAHPCFQRDDRGFIIDKQLIEDMAYSLDPPVVFH